MIESMSIVGAAGIALYAGHHVGDYWVQTDHQARHKGDAGAGGVLNCLLHVISYLLTQLTMLGLLVWATGWEASIPGTIGALTVSGVTHYLADRREHGVMFRLARLLPGKADFLRLGVPYERVVTGFHGEVIGHAPGTPSLGTGGWALDQAWHIFWGVFIPALILGATA